MGVFVYGLRNTIQIRLSDGVGNMKSYVVKGWSVLSNPLPAGFANRWAIGHIIF